jgi:hypothetical protein
MIRDHDGYYRFHDDENNVPAWPKSNRRIILAPVWGPDPYESDHEKGTRLDIRPPADRLRSVLELKRPQFVWDRGQVNHAVERDLRAIDKQLDEESKK